jgi:3-dehydroquinate synthase
VTTVPIPLGDRSYEILIVDGLLDGLGETLARTCPAQRYAVVTDSTVSEILGARVVRAVSAYRPCDLIPFPAGEWNKTAEHWQAVSHRLLGLGLGRDAAVVALGGGEVGDLAGFVAATYMRGIPCVQVPTTLLAMIDSSIGGKTGIDTEFGKNLLGAFHQPRAVVADIATLDTLPPIHLAAGMAEALKHGAIADAGYFRQLVDDAERIFAHDREALHAAVRRSVEITAEVVANDERDAGGRAGLEGGPPGGGGCARSRPRPPETGCVSGNEADGQETPRGDCQVCTAGVYRESSPIRHRKLDVRGLQNRYHLRPWGMIVNRLRRKDFRSFPTFQQSAKH